MSRRTQYTHSERNTARMYIRTYGDAGGKYSQRYRQSNPDRQNNATIHRLSPKLPITWTMYRPLQQTCHAGIHYTHTTSFSFISLTPYSLMKTPASAALRPVLNTCNSRPAHYAGRLSITSDRTRELARVHY